MVAAGFAALLPAVHAATLSVGPGRTFTTPCQAFAVAVDADVVEIDAAGNYAGDVCAIWPNALTIRGVNGRPVLNAAGRSAEGKAIWVIKGQSTTVENVEFTAATVPDRNGAGIRQEGRHLTVRNAYFHHNENGILSGADASSDIVVEHSEFAFNGAGDGGSHNIYIGHVRSFALRASWSHDSVVGHLVKSRAAANRIEYNRLTSEAGGTPSYEIDLPNGGYSVVVGNVIQQSAAGLNGTLVAYGLEGGTNPAQELYLVSNTLVNDRSAGTFVTVGGSTTRVFAADNVFGGVGTLFNSAIVETLNNHASTTPAFVDRAALNYEPAPGAPFVDAGADPGADSQGRALRPVSQYVHPLGLRTRIDDGALDIGAFERDAGGASDTQPPTVGITAPVAGQQLRPGSLTPIKVTAADNRGVTAVEVFVDGALVCRLTAAPYTCTWRVPRVRRTTFTLHATAADVAGNQATSAPVSVSTR